MNLDIDLTIGADTPQSASPDSCTCIEVKLEMHKNNIETHTNQMRNKLGKYKLPMFVIDFPQSAKDFQFPELKRGMDHGEIEYSVIEQNGRVYHCVSLKDKDMVTMKKKIEKVFCKLTQLDNKLCLCLDLYNLDEFHSKIKEKKEHPVSIFLQKSRLKLQSNLDDQFFDMMCQLTQKIAPKFADSPIMACLPMLGDMEIKFQVDSLSDLGEKFKEQLFSFASYEEPDDDQQGKAIKKNFDNKQKAKIYLNFDSLGYLETELQIRMFAFFFSLISM